MPQVNINYLAVLVAAIAGNALGALWYSPALFGKKWMGYMGWTMESMEGRKKGMGAKYFAGFISSLVMAYVLAHFVDYTGATTVAQGVEAGCWIWLGFVATVSLGSILWEGKPKGLYFLNNAYQLVSLVIMGAILAAWA